MGLLLEKYLFPFFLFWYCSGVILLTFDLLPPWLEWANVVFLIASGLLAMIYFIRSCGQPKGYVMLFLVFFLSMTVESIGVRTGLFFGDYSYESDFGPKLIGVPITIGFAWVMVIATSHVLTAPVAVKLKRFKGLTYSLYAAFVATALDLIIDPVAFQVKQYWVWEGPGIYYGIPLSNFYGWFILSFLLHSLLYILLFKNGRWINNSSESWDKKMVSLYGLMTGMFIIIALVNKLFLASIISILTLLLVYFFYFKMTSDRIDYNDSSKKDTSL